MKRPRTNSSTKRPRTNRSKTSYQHIMNFPSWWNVKARQATRLRECGLFTTRALILAARQEDDDGPVADHVPVSIRVRDLYTFCNTSLAHLNVNLSLVSQEEGLRVCGKKRNAVLIHEPPTPCLLYTSPSPRD